MSLPIGELKGISTTVADKLKELGYPTSDPFLAKAATPAGRNELASQLGIFPKEVLELANRADLARLKGIGSVYSDLLEVAGVDTVKELSKRIPANLHAKILSANENDQLTSRPPTLAAVEDWVDQAKNLPYILEY
ncbi:protein of unknown function [Pseudarcicella hirudinis]|uniref:DUF4332 domain-containing protein n=1 Tax=Pseudarcicella hirudinis TaxID=1079859 RepID=A0A1I5SUV2_9BACT|nr:DUF4332 domain-containing protein [Pseudarcicella hirudinis]SFP74552.1 protein of unknown function [Pseudarcicella hirudinis]